MADLVTITNALGAQVTAHTGLRMYPQARDQIQPPCGVVLPAPQVIKYGDTMDEALTLNLMLLVILTDGPPVEKTQRALDAYLGIGTGETESIPAAILADTSLGGTVHFCEPVSVTNYGRIDYAGVTYFGARINLQAGAQ